MRKLMSLALAATMVATTLVGCGVDTPTTDTAQTSDNTTEVAQATDSQATADSAPAEEFDWKKFDGEEITVLFSEHTYADAVEEKLDEFTERIKAMKVAGACDRGELIDLFNWMIPEFNHKETGKFLDGRM